MDLLEQPPHQGRKAAKILIEQQQKGLEMLIEQGILVKVNSVMIPGVNDEHLEEVSARQGQGRLPAQRHAADRRGRARHLLRCDGPARPDPRELQELQDACAGDMNMMRHCRQCRADAVGLLGEDRGDEFTMDKIEEMEIDYEAAMKKRAEVHAAIKENREAKRNKKAKVLVQLTEPRTSRKHARC